MSRYFNNREIELLAPVGTFEDFQQIIKSKADAVYFGGKKFNMRIHNPNHNLSNDEIEKAVKIAHDMGKKVYVTFNNMMSDEELNEAEEFLRFLERVGPDALIIQDFGSIKFIKDLGLNLTLHLSVMANVHNTEMIEKARELSVTRVVTSRDIPLSEIKHFVREYPNMEYEYFVHGDMCSVHGSQCYYSGILFGKSSQRGKCMKVCRWSFKGKDGENYPLAVKDMSLYRHLPELIESGVNSFKIEGRMRGSQYLIKLINTYGDAIDRYIEDPTGYYIDKAGVEFLQENRVRNISTAYAMKKPGNEFIDIEGKREPRIFSKPIEEFDITKEKVQEIKKVLGVGRENKKCNLSVTVNDMNSLKEAIGGGADFIYIPSEVFKPSEPFSKNHIIEACEYAKNKGVKIYYVLPKMNDSRNFTELDNLIPKLKEYGVFGIVIGNIGQLNRYKDFALEMVGNYGLNIYNTRSAEFYAKEGVKRVTLSIEAKTSIVKEVMKNSKVPMEIIVEGAPTFMYMEHCLKAAEYGKTSHDWCRDYCLKEDMDMIDESGITRRIRSDVYCKNHVIPSKDLCYMPVIKELINNGADTLRIEGKHYSSRVIGEIVKVYREAIDKVKNNSINDEALDNYVRKIEEITNTKQSIQALNYITEC